MATGLRGAASRAGDSIQGMDSVQDEVSKLKRHQKTYVIFDFAQIDPVVFRLVTSGGIDTSANVRATPLPEELNKTFSECRAKLKPESLSIVVYDLGYYTDKNNYRSMVILVSHVPEGLDPRHNVALAFNMPYILKSLNVTQHFHIDELGEFSYEHFKSQCSLVQRA